jgi:carbamoylphosphate synthase large subunit
MFDDLFPKKIKPFWTIGSTYFYNVYNLEELDKIINEALFNEKISFCLIIRKSFKIPENFLLPNNVELKFPGGIE